MDRQYSYQKVTFAASGTVSSEFDLRNRELVGIVTDSDFTTSTLTFKGSVVQGGTKIACVDYAGTAVDLTGVAASKYILLNPTITEGLTYTTLTAGTTQVSATTLTLITKERA